jgi:cytoskeletal protein RodZ
MTSRCKVWCALWVALLVNLFAAGQGFATTWYVDVGSSMSPSTLPSLVPGDSVTFRIHSDYHRLFMNGAVMFGGLALLNNQNFTQQFDSEGTFLITDERSNGTCNITVAQPVNAAPTVNITNLALRVAIKAGTNVVLRASADDEDGSIRRVIFQYGLGTNTAALTNIIGTSTVSPYNFTWTNPAAGRYLVRAQAYDNLEVFANSPRINLSLYTPFTNTLPAVTNVSGVSNLVFRFNTDTGLVYAVEVSTNLTNWSAITTNTATNSAIEVLDPNLSALTNRFYRIRLIP